MDDSAMDDSAMDDIKMTMFCDQLQRSGWDDNWDKFALFNRPVCSCPRIGIGNIDDLQIHKQTCPVPRRLRNRAGERFLVAYEARNVRGDVQIGVTYQDGQHHHDPQIMTISASAIDFGVFDAKKAVLWELTRRITSECPDCPRGPIVAGQVRCNVSQDEMVDLRKVAFEAERLGWIRCPFLDGGVLDLDLLLQKVSEILGFSRTEMWFFQDNPGMVLDLKCRNDMRKGGWQRFPDGLTLAHRKSRIARAKETQSNVAHLVKALEAGGCQTSPSKEMKIESLEATLKEVWIDPSPIILRHRRPVVLTNLAAATAMELEAVAANPHKLRVGDTCPKCHKEWKERQLATSTFVGCMC